MGMSLISSLSSSLVCYTRRKRLIHKGSSVRFYRVRAQNVLKALFGKVHFLLCCMDLKGVDACTEVILQAGHQSDGACAAVQAEPSDSVQVSETAAAGLIKEEKP